MTSTNLTGPVSIEHNARHHNSKAYILPSDDLEAQRLQLQHNLILNLFEKRLVLAPVALDEKSEVLDAGTGKGAWALELVKTFPNADKAKVTCIDIGSRLFPLSPPSNMSFEIKNILELPDEWTNRFTLVHQRLLIDAHTYDEWQTAIQNLYRVTAKGGWAQFCEANVVTHMVDFGPVTNRFMDLYNKLGKATGHDFLCSLRIGTLMEEAGFVDVKVEHRLTPFGEWNGEMGVVSAKNTMGVFRGFKTPILNMGGLGVVNNEEEYDSLMDDMETEWAVTPGPSVGWYIIIGHKEL